MEKKSFNLEVKEIKDSGDFEGFVSTYNNIDAGYDKVLPGAFTKSIQKWPQITLLYGHKTEILPIGVAELEDSAVGLKIFGHTNLETQMGREAHALLKQGALKGLSMGYEVQKKDYENGIRLLKEVDVWEASIVVFSMNDKAEIYDVKERKDNQINNLTWLTKDKKEMCVKDFVSMLQNRSENNEKWLLQDIFSDAIMDIVYWSDNSLQEKNKLVKELFKQYQEAFLEWLNKYQQDIKNNNTDNETKEIYDELNNLLKDINDSKEEELFKGLRGTIS